MHPEMDKSSRKKLRPCTPPRTSCCRSGSSCRCSSSRRHARRRSPVPAGPTASPAAWQDKKGGRRRGGQDRAKSPGPRRRTGRRRLERGWAETRGVEDLDPEDEAGGGRGGRGVRAQGARGAGPERVVTRQGALRSPPGSSSGCSAG